MSTRLIRYAPLLALFGLFAAAAMLHMHTAFGAEEPEQALRLSLAARGASYAGDCATTVSPRDIGATCSRLVAEQNDVRAYLVGRTFSEFDRWLFVGRSSAASWQVVAERPMDFTSTSPDVPWP